MVHTQAFTNTAATLLLTLLPLVLAHDNDDRAGEPVGMGAPITTHLSSSEALSAAILNSSNVLPQSYFGYPAFGGLMLAHIVFMTIAWFFVLPVGKFFSNLMLIIGLP